MELSENDCIVCYEKIDDGHVVCNNCKNKICIGCWNEMISRNECPYCRSTDLNIAGIVRYRLSDFFGNELIWVNDTDFWPGRDAFYCYGKTLMLRISDYETCIEYELTHYDPDHHAFDDVLRFYPYENNIHSRWTICNFINKITPIDMQKYMFDYGRIRYKKCIEYSMPMMKIPHDSQFSYYNKVARKILDAFYEMRDKPAPEYVQKIKPIRRTETTTSEDVNEHVKRISHHVSYVEVNGKLEYNDKFIDIDEPLPEDEVIVTYNDFDPSQKVDPNKIHNGHKIMNEVIRIHWTYDPICYKMNENRIDEDKVRSYRDIDGKIEAVYYLKKLEGKTIYKPLDYKQCLALIDSIDWSNIDVSHKYRLSGYTINPLQMEQVFNMITSRMETISIDELMKHYEVI